MTLRIYETLTFQVSWYNSCTSIQVRRATAITIRPPFIFARVAIQIAMPLTILKQITTIRNKITINESINMQYKYNYHRLCDVPHRFSYALKFTQLGWMIVMPCDVDPVEHTVSRKNSASDPMFELLNLQSLLKLPRWPHQSKNCDQHIYQQEGCLLTVLVTCGSQTSFWREVLYYANQTVDLGSCPDKINMTATWRLGVDRHWSQLLLLRLLS